MGVCIYIYIHIYIYYSANHFVLLCQTSVSKTWSLLYNLLFSLSDDSTKQQGLQEEQFIAKPVVEPTFSLTKTLHGALSFTRVLAASDMLLCGQVQVVSIHPRPNRPSLETTQQTASSYRTISVPALKGSFCPFRSCNPLLRKRSGPSQPLSIRPRRQRQLRDPLVVG